MKIRLTPRSRSVLSGVILSFVLQAVLHGFYWINKATKTSGGGGLISLRMIPLEVLGGLALATVFSAFFLLPYLLLYWRAEEELSYIGGFFFSQVAFVLVGVFLLAPLYQNARDDVLPAYFAGTLFLFGVVSLISTVRTVRKQAEIEREKAIKARV